jgi:hypothetical protein
MIKLHRQLTLKHWSSFSLFEQLANVGSEVERTIAWKNKQNLTYSQNAFFRGLELLDFTIADSKNRTRLKELCRLREILVDYFFFDNEYKSTDELWHKYFYAFTYAARANRFSVRN